MFLYKINFLQSVKKSIQRWDCLARRLSFIKKVRSWRAEIGKNTEKDEQEKEEEIQQPNEQEGFGK